MKVVRSGQAPSEEMTGGIFTGTIRMTPLIDVDTGAEQLESALIYFPAGLRNKLHSHTDEQILYVTRGKGVVATRDDEYVIEPGEIVVIPAGRCTGTAPPTTPTSSTSTWCPSTARPPTSPRRVRINSFLHVK